MSARLPATLIPPSIADARGRAFGATMARAFAEFDFRALLFERIETVPSSALPALIRECSVEEFVEPGMSEAVIRRLIAQSVFLHAEKGFIHGVRRGLHLIGLRVVWRQWFEARPKGEPGTHVATCYVTDLIFADQSVVLDARMQAAARRMIDAMKRWSQDVSFELGVAIDRRLALAGAVTAAAQVARDLTPQRPVHASRIGAAASLAAALAVGADARPAPIGARAGLAPAGAITAASRIDCLLTTIARDHARA